MAENPPERTYTHQIRTTLVVEALNSSQWRESLAATYNLNGISKAKGKYLNKLGYLGKGFKDEADYFYIYNIDIIDKDNLITISEQKETLYNIVFYKCNIPSIRFSNYNSSIELQESGIKSQIDCIFYDSDIGDLGFSYSNVSDIKIINTRVKNFILFKSIFCDFYCYNGGVDNIHLKNTKAGDFYIEKDSVIGDLKILVDSSVGVFRFCNASSIKNIQINRSIANSFIFFDKCLLGDFDIKNSITGNIRIDNCTSGYLAIKSSKIGSLIVDDSSCDYLEIQNNCLVGDFEITNSKFSEWDIYNVFASFHFIKTDIGQCRLENCNIPTLRIEGACKMELYVSGYDMGLSMINNIDFEQLTISKDSVISFSQIGVHVCNMNEFATLGNLYFRNIKAANETINFFNKFRNRPNLNQAEEHLLYREKLKSYKQHLKGLKNLSIALPIFRISQSSLGKTEFTECDLAGFNFEFNNSKITEVFISGGTLPENVFVYDERENLTEIEKLQQQKSFFDQLKKVFEGQGDIVRGTKYHARASEIQMQIIEAEKGKRNAEWLVYYLNKISNRHGESWGQAMKFIAIWSIPLYFLYWLCTLQIDFNLNTATWDWKLLGNSIGYYFSFINPTHKLEFIEGADTNLGTMTFDFLGRIVVGYGIYQLISAFRKHGKKG